MISFLILKRAAHIDALKKASVYNVGDSRFFLLNLYEIKQINMGDAILNSLSDEEKCTASGESVMRSFGSQAKLRNWCDNNNISYYHSPRDGSYEFKKR